MKDGGGGGGGGGEEGATRVGEFMLELLFRLCA